MKIAVDFGGMVIKVSAYEGESPEPLWFETLEANSMQGMGQALARVKNLIGSRATGALSCMGIASPGIVDPVKCRVTFINGKYEDAVSVDFREWCRENFNCSLVMINDANAALRGETAYGCAVGYENAVMLILGTGVGTAAMMNGRMVTGVHNQAGILGGHFIVNPFGRGCNCGAVGCLETYAGSKEIIYQAEADRGRVKSRIFEERPLSMKWIAACRRYGDAYASRIMNTAIGYYAAAAVNMIHAYDPECVVLSGGITNSQEIVDEIVEIVRRQAWLPYGEPAFLHAENPDRSVTLGLVKEMNEHGYI